jgi:hypothetical protein
VVAAELKEDPSAALGIILEVINLFLADAELIFIGFAARAIPLARI